LSKSCANCFLSKCYWRKREKRGNNGVTDRRSPQRLCSTPSLFLLPFNPLYHNLVKHIYIYIYVCVSVWVCVKKLSPWKACLNIFCVYQSKIFKITSVKEKYEMEKAELHKIYVFHLLYKTFYNNKGKDKRNEKSVNGNTWNIICLIWSKQGLFLSRDLQSVSKVQGTAKLMFRVVIVTLNSPRMLRSEAKEKFCIRNYIILKCLFPYVITLTNSMELGTTREATSC
jgi:hypothetical protein